MVTTDQLAIYALILFIAVGIALMLWILFHLVMESHPAHRGSAQPAVRSRPRF